MKFEKFKKCSVFTGNLVYRHILSRRSLMWAIFCSECLTKFGQVVGTNVWNAVNEVFDCMPFAAIIDKQVSCYSGCGLTIIYFS